MILLLDIGNAQLKWGLFSSDGLKPQPPQPLHHHSLPVLFNQLWCNCIPPTRVVVSNCAGVRVAQVLADWVTTYWGVTVEFRQAAQETLGLRNGYEDPQTLSPDSWYGLVGAWQHYQQAVCVIDCGVTLKVHAVSETGQHLGGLLLPGVSLMESSLLAYQEVLPQSSSADLTQGLLAQNAAHARQGGAWYATVAFIEAIVAELSLEIGAKLVSVMTGGNALPILPLLKGRFEYEPDLVLKGLISAL